MNITKWIENWNCVTINHIVPTCPVELSSFLWRSCWKAWNTSSFWSLTIFLALDLACPWLHLHRLSSLTTPTLLFTVSSVKYWARGPPLFLPPPTFLKQNIFYLMFWNNSQASLMVMIPSARLYSHLCSAVAADNRKKSFNKTWHWHETWHHYNKTQFCTIGFWMAKVVMFEYKIMKMSSILDI